MSKSHEGIDVLGGVFISYRREDSAYAARLIYDRLTKRLDRKNVFFDVDNIEPGLDFVDILTERVGACDALVVVIGKNWISATGKDNRRRLDDPRDFVRIEIEAALERDVRVIPVLVEGADMPKTEELPDSLKMLSRRQGIDISHNRFDSDVRKLTRTLSLLEEDLRKRDAAEAEHAARDEREKREAVEAAEKAERAQQLAEAEAHRAIEERRAAEAAEADRAAREERERQEAAEAADKANRQRLLAEAEARRPVKKQRAETNEGERAAREEWEKRDAAEKADKAQRTRQLAEAERQPTNEERRAAETAQAERAARGEREKWEAAEKAERTRRLAETEATPPLAPLRAKWGWIVALGVIYVVAGFIALGSLVAATVATVYVVGIMMTIAGVVELITAFQVKSSGRLFWFVLGVLYIVAGFSAFDNPLLTAMGVTLFLGAAVVASGIVSIYLGFSMRTGSPRVWVVIPGIVTLLLGLIILAHWPVSSLWTLGILLSFNLVIAGASRIGLGVGARYAPAA